MAMISWLSLHSYHIAVIQAKSLQIQMAILGEYKYLITLRCSARVPIDLPLARSVLWVVFLMVVSLLSPINTILPRIPCKESHCLEVGPQTSENWSKAPLESSILLYSNWLLLQSSLLPPTNRLARNLFIIYP